MSSSSQGVAPDPDLAAEQTAVTDLYRRLDAARELAVTRFRQALAMPIINPQSLGEREAAARFQGQRITALDAADHGLVIGRLDREVSPQPLYIGRVGLPADDPAGDPALVDWRAPASRPFYTATPFRPEGVVRRRHIRTRSREVTAVHDEVLTIDATETDGPPLTGEAALMAALTAERTGRMTDIVATIQAEQDAIIRSDARGVLVVQGGPGTGKTAVALHRAAYLLYTHRDRLARSGLLVVGPTPTFLRYIADVLPALGETGVLLAGLGQLRPGLDARGSEAPEVAEVKGRLAMVDVLKAAVRDRETVPRGVRELVIDGVRIPLRPVDLTRCRTTARRASRQHNLGRPAFVRALAELVAQRYADRIGGDVRGGADLLDRRDVEALQAEVVGEPAVRQLVDEMWPVLTPEGLLRDLLADPARIRRATKGWTEEDRALLARPADAPWTPADVPLLEEADELLGFDDSAERAREARRRRRAQEEAQDTLDLLHGSRSTDLEDDEEGEELTAGDLLDAERLAERDADLDTRTAAERAATDRTWVFGHVVVDEAQELSAMTWRLLARKCPTRSMTVVGDLAQTGSLAGATDWGTVLQPHVGEQWRLAQLTVNYRTPAEIMAVAADVLAAGGAATAAPRSVRSTGVPPVAEQLPEDALLPRAAEVTAELVAAGGTVAVIVPPSRVPAVVDCLAGAFPVVSAGPAADSSAGPVVLVPAEAKGLEFDSVLLVDPQGLLDEGVRGHSDLYVALTRPTQRLTVLSPGALPAELHRLTDDA
ncbi:DNA/RNA helicase, superfamily I [Modestobacter italicus]|uniref:DNA/RNA helicase, superfamily I n=1 Tax=Modestobacter italicus (strain DSM 44449 / CECT 9708 / BC 501) TaxID=2732864 RepID=I4F1X2_MODI5|nr:AAA family ATPase [Modestobacter marinus]CCH89635.1 DNA/RNA helicase, superfamily I [Modestobacter marinus]